MINIRSFIEAPSQPLVEHTSTRACFPRAHLERLVQNLRQDVAGLGISGWCYDTTVMNVVLVHGILGFRQKFGVEYFRGVAERFRAQGFAVLVPVLLH